MFGRHFVLPPPARWYISIQKRQKTISTTDDYQFLQRSKLPTLYFQSSLPRLPIPLLERTCERYLAAVQPILEPASYTQTVESVSKFRQTIGGDLHAMLKLSDAANKNTSYISEPWFDMYLSDRTPLPLNYNPLLVMKHDTRSEYNTQLLRSANLVISSLRFWRSLQEHLLEPEVYHMNPRKSNTPRYRQIMRLTPSVIATYVSYAFKAFPLDMSQYGRLFSVSRIPEVSKDRLLQAEPHESRHILVMRRGNLYAVDVMTATGDIEQPNIILGRLKAVLLTDDKRSEAEHPLGCLTAIDRDAWAKARAYIQQQPENAELLQKIDSALFCLCLDSSDSVAQGDITKQVPLLKNMLAGDATNRWFDKSVSVIVNSDGTSAVSFEHSWGDGVAVLRYFNEIYKETIEAPHVHPNTVPYMPNDNATTVRPINLKVDAQVAADIDKARKSHADKMATLDMHILRYPHISKNSCKRYRLSPDSIMQLSFQLAYRQAFGKYVGTYESCSTSAFKHGRTETVRPCTMATKSFCEAVLTSADDHRKPNAKQLRAMLDQCSTKHAQLTKEAAMGQGFDRHLFGLRHMAAKNGIDVPSLYTEKAYKKLNYNIISTSTLGSEALLAGSFGPVVSDGIGLGYSIQNEECGAIATTYKGQCNGQVFVDSLEDAFNKIRDIVTAAGPSTSN